MLEIEEERQKIRNERNRRDWSGQGPALEIGSWGAEEEDKENRGGKAWTFRKCFNGKEQLTLKIESAGYNFGRFKRSRFGDDSERKGQKEQQGDGRKNGLRKMGCKGKQIGRKEQIGRKLRIVS